MFRMILNVEDIDYNSLIDMLSEIIKQNKDHPAMKSLKIPAMSFSMLKKLPKDKKNEMLAMVVNQDKKRTIQTLQSVLSARVGECRIGDTNAHSISEGVQLCVDVLAYDFDRGIELFLPKYLTSDDYQEALGDETCEETDMDTFCRQVKELPLEEKEIVFLRSVRMKREKLLFDIENFAKAKGISLRIQELKILVRR